MIKIVAFVISMVLIGAINAQIPNKLPGGISGKIKKEKGETGSDAKVTDNPLTSSPADADVSQFKNEFVLADENVRKKYDGAAYSLSKLSNLLVKIKETDPKHKELEALTKQYEELKSIFDKNESIRTENEYFRRRASSGSSLETSMKDALMRNLNTYCDSLIYDEIQLRISQFESKYPEEDKYYVKEMKKFYNDALPNRLQPRLISVFDTEMKYLDENYESKAPQCRTRSAELMANIDKALKISPSDAGFLASKSKAEEQQKKINAYIDSGEYDKWVANHKQELIDAVKLDPSQMTDAGVDTFVKNNIKTSEFGTPVKINIQNKSWQVEQNSLGVPINKYLYVQVATKKDGKCYYTHLWVRKDHQGGGSYGSMYLDQANVLDEMNCNNIK